MVLETSISLAPDPNGLCLMVMSFLIFPPCLKVSYYSNMYNCLWCVIQPFDKAANALALATSPVVRALIDPEGAMRNIRDLDSVTITPFKI